MDPAANSSNTEDNGIPRMRKATKKKQESEAVMPTLASAFLPVGILSEGTTAVTAAEALPQQQQQQKLNKDGTPRKKRGRPSKTDEIGDPGGWAAAAAATESTPRVLGKRGRPKGGSKASQLQVEQHDQQQLGQQQPPSQPQPLSKVDERAADIARKAQQKAQKEKIRQEQAFAQAQSKQFLATMASPDARHMIQASAMNQVPISPSVIQRTTSQAAVKGSNSGGDSSLPEQAVAAAVAVFPPNLQEKYYQNLQRPKQKQQQQHGKTNVTTQNQHPQQGTVAPHIHHTSPMSPRTMKIMLRGSTSASEDMAMSNLPMIAGGGVLSGATMTGPAAGMVVGVNTNHHYHHQSSGGSIGGLRGNAKNSTTETNIHPTTMIGSSNGTNIINNSNNGSGAKQITGNLPATATSSTAGNSDTTAVMGVGTLAGAGQMRRMHPKITVPDEDPFRIVNPLLALPPPLPPPQGGNRNSLSSGTAGGGLAGASPSAAAVAGGAVAEVPLPVNLIAGTELQAWLSLVFSKPNTFSIAQYARMLGFQVPDVDEAKDGETWLAPGATEVPFELCIQDDMTHHVPAEGHFSSMIWKTSASRLQMQQQGNIIANGSYSHEHDHDALLEGEFDPLYQSFLEQSDEWTTTPNSNDSSNNAPSPFRNLVYHHIAKVRAQIPPPKRIQQILEQAQEYGIIEQDQWSIEHVMRSTLPVNPIGLVQSQATTPAIGATNDAHADENGLATAPSAATVAFTTPGPTPKVAVSAPITTVPLEPAPLVATSAPLIVAVPLESPLPAATSAPRVVVPLESPLPVVTSAPLVTVLLESPLPTATLPTAAPSTKVPLVATPASVPLPGVSVLETLPDQSAAPISALVADISATPLPTTTAIIATPSLLSPTSAPSATAAAVLTAPVAMPETRATISSKENIWGFTAWQKVVETDKPNMSMILHYQFQWYRLVSESSKGTKVSELVMRIPYGPLPAILGDSNIMVPPSKEEDHFADEMAEIAEGTLSPRQRLIIILYSLVLEHARRCHVWYAFLQVPLSLVPLLQKYFRVTPVPAKELKATGLESDSATEKETTLISMLCDLNKCSIDYALLLQREALWEPCASSEQKDPDQIDEVLSVKERLLVRLPTMKEVKYALPTPIATPAQAQPFALSGTTGPADYSATMAEGIAVLPQELARGTPVGGQSQFGGASGTMGTATVQMQAIVVNDHATTVAIGVPRADELDKVQGGATTVPIESKAAASGLSLQVKSAKQEGELMSIIAVTPLETAFCRPVKWDVVKCYPVGEGPPPNILPLVTALRDEIGGEQQSSPKRDVSKNDVLAELQRKQEELAEFERGILEPRMRSLLGEVIKERREYEESDYKTKKIREQGIWDAHEKMIARRKEFDEAWLKQLELDMDAVCEICNDGEVTPDNQILFCEACDVAIHQLCYGIERVPAGDYYCLACRHFKRQKVNSAVERQMRYKVAAAAAAAGETDLAAIVQQRTAAQTLPVCCELCPVRYGAFIPADDARNRRKLGDKPRAPELSKWVHMVCAKWQGLNFVESAKPDLLVEDVADMKINFRLHQLKCSLCLGDRGAFNKCRAEGCSNWLHILCARFSGMCDVVHGENARGNIEANPWTLLCPDHSDTSFGNSTRTQKCILPVHKLVLMSESFPPQPKLDPRVIYANARPDKPFVKLTGEERKQAFSNTQYEKELIEELSRKLFGVRCEVCDQWEEDGKSLTRCHCCGVVFCDSCVVEGDKVDVTKRTKYRCTKCSYISEQKKLKREGKIVEIVEPQCDVCCQKQGWLRKGSAEPVSKKVWKGKEKLLVKSLFGKQLWCHCLCALWCAPAKLNINATVGCVELSQVILSNGNGFIKPKDICFLCGNSKGLKEPCAEEDCCLGTNGNRPCFHPTCARQAGLEVKDSSDMPTLFYTKCYNHGGNDFNLRARLEDLIEIEVKRAGKGFLKQALPMTFSDASRLLNASILAIRILGWSWRWGEWWVAHDSNWEPLLEPGQNEEKMTKAQLKIVVSTPESRRDDARRCRLAPFGAALRNRAYDEEDDGVSGGFDHDSLERALRAVLHTKSLVGPLKEIEIDFFVEWLGRAYRSKSRLLGFGDAKIEVGSADFCLNQKTSTPKCDLGGRPIPGRQELRVGNFYEDPVDEVDDFDVYNESVMAAIAKQEASAKAEPRKKAPKAKKRKIGRPPKIRQLAMEKEPESVAEIPVDDVVSEVVPLRHSIERGRKRREVAKEVAAPVEAKKGGRHRKRPLTPEPEPEPENEPEIEVTHKVEELPKKKRRQRMAVPTPPRARQPVSNLLPENRSQTKPPAVAYVAEGTKKENNATRFPRRRLLRDKPTSDGEEDSLGPSEEIDVPIATLLGSNRQPTTTSGALDREGSQGAPHDSPGAKEGVAVADNISGYNGIKIEASNENTTTAPDTAVAADANELGDESEENEFDGDLGNDYDGEAWGKNLEENKSEENKKPDGEHYVCAEDRMESEELFLAPAQTARQRGRLIGKREAIDEFFRSPRSFVGRI